MANPRKFSEKIALHTQKQAEEKAAFEAILRDVTAATRGAYQNRNQQLHIRQNIMHQCRGGSLPNVNQMAVASNSSVDLQSAIKQRDELHGGGTTRMHPRDRAHQQVGPHRSRQFLVDSRADCSPYQSYLCPPADTSWRRTNSDSAIHTSTMGGGSGSGDMSPNTPPMHRRIHEMVGENTGMSGDLLNYPWDPKKMQQRPKSCEVPSIIYPSTGQDPQMSHIPITNNTGSLPDLSVHQFQSPLTNPIDVDEQQTYGTNPASLSPTSAHHLNMATQQQHPTGSPAQSPGSQRRRPNQGGPSPLVLTSNGSQPLRMPPHSPPVSNIDPSRMHLNPRMRHHNMLYMQQQQQQRRGGPVSGLACAPSPTSPADPPQNHQGTGPPRVPPPHMGPVPHVCVTSHENDETSEPSMTQYRTTNNVGDSGCQSPTSPRSQPSYSPSQSPVLPPTSWPQTFEMDSYRVQQQQANALQHRFEHFNMLHDNQQQRGDGSEVISSNGTSSMVNNSPLMSTFSPEFQFSTAAVSDASTTQLFQSLQSPLANSKIPEIILPVTGIPDNAFDSELFDGSDEDFKRGLGQLDVDSLQLLNDATFNIADPDTENSFRFDEL